MLRPDPLDERRSLVDDLRSCGIVDERVLAVMAEVPRDAFVPHGSVTSAYENRALSIGSRQTISQPLVVAEMTSALELGPTDRVLEIGTGSGYHSAVLAGLASEVISIERLEELAQRARATLDELGITAVTVYVGDGSIGRPQDGPYDAILVTAAGPAIPAALVAQLAPGGRLVMPVGDRHLQHLTLVRRSADGSLTTDVLSPVVFVPLIGEEGFDD